MSKKKTKDKAKPAKVRDLLRGIRVMQKERLGLSARILVYIGNGETEYEVVGISHFHVIPDLILKVRKTHYDK